MEDEIISTVGELKKLLADVPDNYRLKAEFGNVKGNFLIETDELDTFDVEYIATESEPVLILGLCNKIHEEDRD